MESKVVLENGRIPVSSPESVGIGSRCILDYFDRVQRECPSLHAFQIVRKGRLIADAAAKPYTRESFHRIYSAAKGIVATAVLLCVQDGLYTLEEPVLKYFPKEWLPADPDPRWEELTLYHLLTMTSGHRQDTMFKMLMGKSDCWVRTFLEERPDYPFGTHFVYDMGAQYVMNELVRLAVGKDLGQFMEERVFGPMGVLAQWEYTPIEGHFWSSTMQLQPEGLTKLSLLYLQEGEWNGKQLLRPDLVRYAMKQHVPCVSEHGDRGNRENGAGYSLHMWRNSFGGVRYSGGQGQLGIVVPEYETVYSTLAAADGSQTNALIDAFYECVLRKCREKPLPEDPESCALLRARLESFNLAPSGVAADSPAARQVSGKTYVFEENPAGQKSVRFDFTGGEVTVTTDSGRGVRTHTCGLNGEWKESRGYLLLDKEDGEIADLDRIFNYDVKATLLSGGWRSENCFEFKLRGPALLCDYTYVCSFEGNEVRIALSSTCHADPTVRMGESAAFAAAELRGRAV